MPYAHASVCTAWLLLRLYCVYQLAIPSNNVDRRAPAPYSAMEVIMISDNSDSDSNLSIYDTSEFISGCRPGHARAMPGLAWLAEIIINI